MSGPDDDVDQERMCISYGCLEGHHTVTCPLFEKVGEKEETEELRKKLGELDTHAGLEGEEAIPEHIQVGAINQGELCDTLGCSPCNGIHVEECSLHEESVLLENSTAERLAREKGRLEDLDEKIEAEPESEGNPVVELTEKQEFEQMVDDIQAGEEFEKSALKKWEESVQVELKRRGFTAERVKAILAAHKESTLEENIKKLDDPPEAKELERRFTYHAPKGNQNKRYVKIRLYALGFAQFISANCPESRERSLALTKLEEAVMWANASIARRE